MYPPYWLLGYELVQRIIAVVSGKCGSISYLTLCGPFAGNILLLGVLMDDRMALRQPRGVLVVMPLRRSR